MSIILGSYVLSVVNDDESITSDEYLTTLGAGIWGGVIVSNNVFIYFAMNRGISTRRFNALSRPITDLLQLRIATLNTWTNKLTMRNYSFLF